MELRAPRVNRGKLAAMTTIYEAASELLPAIFATTQMLKGAPTCRKHPLVFGRWRDWFSIAL